MIEQYQIFKVCYEPPLSMETKQWIKYAVGHSMMSPIEDSFQYDLNHILESWEDTSSDNKKDLAILKELDSLGVEYIELQNYEQY